MVLVDYEYYYNIPKVLPTLLASGHHQLVCKFLVVILYTANLLYFFALQSFFVKKTKKNVNC